MGTSQSSHWPVNQLIPSTKNTLGCCLNHCTTVVLTSSDLSLWAFSTFLRETKNLEVIWWQVWTEWEMVQHLAVYRVQYVLDSTGHMGTGIVIQHMSVWACQDSFSWRQCENLSGFHSSAIQRLWCYGSLIPALEVQCCQRKWSCLDEFCTWNSGV
jgi:hypothetical protein